MITVFKSSKYGRSQSGLLIATNPAFFTEQAIAIIAELPISAYMSSRELEAHARTLVTPETLYEYYNTGDAYQTDIRGTFWRGQTFTPSIGHKIGSVKLKLYREGYPGTMTVSIRATNGSIPVGSDLCSGMTNANTLPTWPTIEWREILFSSGYSLSAGIKYAIVARVPDGNISNRVYWREVLSSPTYTGGNYVNSLNGGSSWSGLTSIDLMFEEYELQHSELEIDAYMTNRDIEAYMESQREQ